MHTFNCPQKIGVPAYQSDDPMVATAIGAGRGIEDVAFLRRTLAGI